MDRTKPKIPFVGLHGHSTFSVYDAIGFPNEHLEEAYKNGLDALALTDHGNCNGLSYQILHSKKMKKEGRGIKPIYGIEAYYHPSIEDWKQLKQEMKDEKDKVKEDDEVGSLVVEDEGETKKKKNPLKKRSHLVILAQNQKGLNNLYSLVSESFKEGYFYSFPRMDFDLLKKHNEGLIISTACMGGLLATDYWENKENGSTSVLEVMEKTCKQFLSVFGERFFGELQWNANLEQHTINQLIIELSKKLGFKLISTADSHYPKQNLWKDRILYKKLNPRFPSDGTLPNSVDEVGYELYPKNGDQMMDAYEKYSSLCNVKYDDDLVKETITNTHHIAFQMIDDFIPDNSIKLPDFIVPLGVNPNDLLRQKCYNGLKKKKKDQDPVYIERLERELNVICRNGFAKYFLTMEKIHEIASEICLEGTGRGSASGALLTYVLGICQVDPIRFNLLFERFMTAPKPSGFYDPNKDYGGIKTKVDNVIKVENDDGSFVYLTEDLVKGIK